MKSLELVLPFSNKKQNLVELKLRNKGLYIFLLREFLFHLLKTVYFISLLITFLCWAIIYIFRFLLKRKETHCRTTYEQDFSAIHSLILTLFQCKKKKKKKNLTIPFLTVIHLIFLYLSAFSFSRSVSVLPSSSFFLIVKHRLFLR